MKLTVNKSREQNLGDMSPIFTSNPQSTRSFILIPVFTKYYSGVFSFSQTFLQINNRCKCSLWTLSHPAGIKGRQIYRDNYCEVQRFKPAESLSSSPLMRKKPATPLLRGADIVRSTLPTTPEPGMKENPRRTRNDTYHGNTREYSDTDYAHSLSR